MSTGHHPTFQQTFSEEDAFLEALNASVHSTDYFPLPQPTPNYGNVGWELGEQEMVTAAATYSWPNQLQPFQRPAYDTTKPPYLYPDYSHSLPARNGQYPAATSSRTYQHEDVLGGAFDSLMRGINQNNVASQQPDTLSYSRYYGFPLEQTPPPFLSSEQVLSQSSPFSNSSTPSPSMQPTVRPRGASSHRRVSSQEKDSPEVHMHQCDTCSCSFARARDLTRHYRLHTGEKPYLCEACGSRFIRSDARARHWKSNPTCAEQCRVK